MSGWTTRQFPAVNFSVQYTTPLGVANKKQNTLKKSLALFN